MKLSMVIPLRSNAQVHGLNKRKKYQFKNIIAVWANGLPRYGYFLPLHIQLVAALSNRKFGLTGTANTITSIAPKLEVNH